MGRAEQLAQLDHEDHEVISGWLSFNYPEVFDEALQSLEQRKEGQ